MGVVFGSYFVMMYLVSFLVFASIVLVVLLLLCFCVVSVPRLAVGWSAVCDFVISWSYIYAF